MEATKTVEKEVFKILKWNASRYYDYPDGQDLIGKLTYMNKISGLLGTILGLMNIETSLPRPATVTEKFLRYSQTLLPCLGAATTFTCVTYISTNIRKKDDELNYVLGGLAAGSLLIPFTGKVNFGVSAALVFAAAGYFKKNAKMANQDLFKRPVRRYKSAYYDRVTDTSLEPDTRRGNWTK